MKRSVDARTMLAFGITLAALIGITALAITIIATNDTGGKAQNVLNAVLPLFGTWVGTVLAYYFSRENFQAASDSTQQLVRQLTPEERLRSIPVADVMIKNILSGSLDDKVETVFQNLQQKNIKRLPILQSSGALEALLYLEGIGAYLLGVPEAERANKTLGDLLKERPDLKQTPAFVSEEQTLAEAKTAMEHIENCKVIFVTKTGSATDPVVGLLTTTDIVKNSKA